MIIRKLEKSETKAAAELVETVFMRFEAPDYSKEGIRAFRETAVHNEAYMNALEIYGAFDDENTLAGIIATRCGGTHIALFFVDEKYQRQGVGKKLFTEALKACPSDSVTVNSSPFAVEIYHRLGFSDTAAEQISDGIRYTPMIYKK